MCPLGVAAVVSKCAVCVQVTAKRTFYGLSQDMSAAGAVRRRKGTGCTGKLQRQHKEADSILVAFALTSEIRAKK